MRFKFLTGDMNWQTYGGSFVSKKLNNGEFDYWLVLEVINWNEHEREPQETYNVSLHSVSPSEAGKENLLKAADCCGIKHDADILNDPIVQVDILKSYGVSAPLWQANGNNLKKLMREAHKQADIANMMYGFFMDAPKNRIGSTGWDVQRGNLLAGLDKAQS